VLAIEPGDETVRNGWDALKGELFWCLEIMKEVAVVLLSVKQIGFWPHHGK
jgi:hypothetical protein